MLIAAAAFAPAIAQPLDGRPSREILARFEAFGRTGKMPPDLGRWLSDPRAQYVEPYKAFDDVYYVGVCWVSAWLVNQKEIIVRVQVWRGSQANPCIVTDTFENRLKHVQPTT